MASTYDAEAAKRMAAHWNTNFRAALKRQLDEMTPEEREAHRQRCAVWAEMYDADPDKFRAIIRDAFKDWLVNRNPYAQGAVFKGD